jgi:hypothetical protein
MAQFQLADVRDSHFLCSPRDKPLLEGSRRCPAFTTPDEFTPATVNPTHNIQQPVWFAVRL